MTGGESLPILHGANISPYVRKVRVVLAYKGIDYNNTQQSPFGAPREFVAKSPLSKIPCWEEGELILPDSSVIVSYLEYRYPDPPLLPAEAGPRARALWFQEYAATKLRDTVADVFFQRVIRPSALKQETDTQRVAYLLNSALPKVFDYLTGCLGDDEFMVGGAFSIADIAIASPFVNFALAGGEVDAGRWPEFTNYIQRVHGQPCYAPIVKADLEGEFARFRPEASGDA
jgi:glutathione S-transferase